jgi:hypothetical protein
MVVFLYRPSPQVPKPSIEGVIACYDACAYNIAMQMRQVNSRAVDITWIFLQTLFMAINTILWTVTYPQIRALHSKEELERHIAIALEIIDKCSERWPGTASASALYAKLSKAILKSYRTNSEISLLQSSLSAASPSSLIDASSPRSEISSATTSSAAHSTGAPRQSFESTPTFGNVFDQPIPDYIPVTYGQSISSAQPAFRSNSIFLSPPGMQADRQFSYFPPEFPQQDLPNPWDLNSVPQMRTHLPPQLNPMGPMQDISYLLQPPTLSFGQQFYAEQSLELLNQQASLDQQQQIELMNNLETEGMVGIEDYLSMPSIAQYQDPNRR